ncbi:RHS repeat-associated core domain-containing protein [Litorimonas sp. WD9-15]|uniref:RHS repeat-associated core domain-containing protein n=1 Tax=Litorimonas sp. WD9-15 TaxID=3418716 RepID=UPI003D08CBDE
MSKTLADGSVIHYHYDEQGRMMAETDGLTGATIRDYIWFGLSPVAVDSAADGLHYIHTDHLGRPAFVTDPSGTSVWDGGITTPFGYSLGVVGTFTQKLMFPGQYRDEETGYDQNWNRTYDPELGRYLQSDPIGLAGGLNRYAYVGGNPVSRVDPTGLIAPVVVRVVGGAIIGGGVDLGGQVLANVISGKPALENLDWRSIGVSALAGGFGGGAAGLRNSLFGNALISGAVSGGIDAALQECASIEDVLIGVGTGAGSGLLFNGSGRFFRNKYRKFHNVVDFDYAVKYLDQGWGLTPAINDQFGNALVPFTIIGGSTGLSAVQNIVSERN